MNEDSVEFARMRDSTDELAMFMVRVKIEELLTDPPERMSRATRASLTCSSRLLAEDIATIVRVWD
jgi:hypothetical protein